jgi:hypothetical protein
MRRLFSIFMFSILFLSGCDGAIDKKTLLFTDAELANFSPFNTFDTIIYSSVLGNSDTIVIHEITAHELNPKTNNGILSAEPSNNKSIYIEHYHKPSTSFSGSTTESSSDRKNIQCFLSFIIKPTPRIMRFRLEFKNFYFITNQYQDFLIKKDTIIGQHILKSFYKFPHSHPETVESSTDISTVFWAPKIGLVAYVTKQGDVFTHHNNVKKKESVSKKNTIAKIYQLQHYPGKMTMTSSGQVSPSSKLILNGIAFDVVLRDKDTTYTATTQKNFITPEGFSVGMQFSELPQEMRNNLIKEPGWAYYYKLQSNWCLGFCEGVSCTDNYPNSDSKIKWIFKRR